jgi:hypothetical protein
VHFEKKGKVRDDTLENRFTEGYETGVLEGEIEGEMKFREESSVLRRKKNENE